MQLCMENYPEEPVFLVEERTLLKIEQQLLSPNFHTNIFIT